MEKQEQYRIGRDLIPAVRIKNREDMQVLTISVDDTPALAAAYVQEKGYTFPVIHAPARADKLLPWAGLPTNFLVNSEKVRTSFFSIAGRKACAA
jgi:hypothetical protein